MEKTRLLQLKPMAAVYVYDLSQNPEEAALKKIMEIAHANGLNQKGSQLFGRNIYPTDQPEPHGYEYYLTIKDKAKLSTELATGEVTGGLYAVMEDIGLFSLSEGWKQLFTWVETNGYKSIGVKKSAYGWVNSGFEELTNWQEQKPPTEWVFRLMVQLKEEDSAFNVGV